MVAPHYMMVFPWLLFAAVIRNNIMKLQLFYSAIFYSIHFYIPLNSNNKLIGSVVLKLKTQIIDLFHFSPYFWRACPVPELRKSLNVMDPMFWRLLPPLQNGSSSVNSSLVDSVHCCGLELFFVSWLLQFRLLQRMNQKMIM